MPTFLSTARFARVTFPPEQFGMGDGVETFFDKQGNSVSKKSPHRAAKFDAGRLEENKPKRIEMLRKHPGNRANGGDLFWEQPVQDAAGMAALNGRMIASMPEGGLTDEDIAMLKALHRSRKGLAPKAMDSIRAQAVKIYERFRMAGIQPPPPEYNINRTKARIIDMLGVIEDEGIWKAGDDEDGADKG